MTQLTSSSERKRTSSDDRASKDDPLTYSTEPAKRRRTLSPAKASSSGLSLLIPGKDIPPTPPSSVAGAATTTLKLIIPREQISHEQQRRLNRHKSDAERWKPKLQRPYPKQTEIKNAYPLKLMRHYADQNGRSQSSFTKPQINKSSRVSRLLQQFPLTETEKQADTPVNHAPGPLTPLGQPIPLSARLEYLEHARLGNVELRTNMYITKTRYAQRLAWKAFSLPEQGRIGRGRESMIHSGLLIDDLQLEAVGRQNGLPDWKKPWTGRFALLGWAD